MKDIKLREWEESYERGENNILYPQEEVVRFLNRYITKKLDYSGGRRELIEANKHNKIRCLDFGSGVGVHSMLCEEFGLEAYGVDISNIAINKAKFNAKTRGFDELSDRFIILHYCAAIMAAAIEASLEAAQSALLVTTIGTLPPTIIPAAHAPKK